MATGNTAARRIAPIDDAPARDDPAAGAPGARGVLPVRLRLSRARGFSLHQASYAANGRDARKVDRATAFGNPFRYVTQELLGCAVWAEERAPATAAAELVAQFRRWLADDSIGRALTARCRAELAGCNLACWCRLDMPCHADVLLAVANGQEWANVQG